MADELPRRALWEKLRLKDDMMPPARLRGALAGGKGLNKPRNSGSHLDKGVLGGAEMLGDGEEPR